MAAGRDDKLRTLVIYDPAGCPPDMGLDNRARSPGARMLGVRGLGGSPGGSRHGSISVRCVGARVWVGTEVGQGGSYFTLLRFWGGISALKRE